MAHRLRGIAPAYVACIVALWCLLGTAHAAAPLLASSALDLVLTEVPLRTALQVIAEQSGRSLNSDLPLAESTSIDLHNVPVDEAVAVAIADRPYGFEVGDRTIRVWKSANAGPVNAAPVAPVAVAAAPVVEPTESRIVVLELRRADEVRDLVQGLVAGDIRFAADARTNAIVMTGTRKRLDEVSALLRDIDGTPQTRQPEDKREYLSEVFSLEHVTDFRDLENNLNMILYGGKNSQGPQSTVNVQNQQPQQGMIPPAPIVPVLREYYLLDRVRRVLMITAMRDKMEIIRRYFERVNTPLPQVLIEASVVALDTAFERTLGIDWNMIGSYRGPTKSLAGPLGIPESTQQQGGAQNTTLDPAQGFQFGQLNLSNLTAQLEAAQSDNKGQILSRPRIMAMTGTPALIHIGSRVPYRQSTTVGQTGTTENVTFVDVGIRLDVTPEINVKAGTVLMKLHPEVSDVAGFRGDAPIITTRQADTTVEVKDGETLIIGGLLRNENLNNRASVPFLREIPLLGEFFRFARKTKNRSNLVILITPRIVTTNGRAVAQTEPATATPVASPTPVVRKSPEYYRSRLGDIRSKYIDRAEPRPHE